MSEKWTQESYVAAMLDWARQQRELDARKEELEQVGLDLMGKTTTIGNTRLSITQPRGSYDYFGAGQRAPKEIIEQHTELIEKVDWKGVCEVAGIEAPYHPGEGGSKATLKLL